jgi:Flp pilus assembly protein TadG
MVIFALSFAFILGIVALALEGGHAEYDRRFLQEATDGAALAGAEYLDTDTSATNYNPTSARQTAVKYVTNALSGGTQAGSGLSCTYSSDIAPPPNPNSCNPDSTHSLTVTTPYNGHPEQILVRLDNVTAVILGSFVGVSKANTAARSVAGKLAGGGPFPFALYVGGNLTANGNANLQVGGNLFVRGCINFTNSDELVAFAGYGEPGAIEVLDDSATAARIGGSSTSPQVWDQGKAGCFAKVFARDSFGAGGSGATATCGKTDTAADVPGHFFLTCPSGEPPVKDLPPPVGFRHNDPCATAAPVPLTSSPSPPAAANMTPGCYDACSANAISGTFASGVYGFIGTTCTGGTSPNMIFSGDASGSGVSFVLTNGAGVCVKSCSSGAGKGSPVSLSFTTPTTGANQGILFYDCSGGSLGCSSGGGQINFKGPGTNVNFAQPSLIYAPSSTCTLTANGAQLTFGQIICNDLNLQGGSSSSSEQVFFGGPSLPSPLFDVRLIE